MRLKTLAEKEIDVKDFHTFLFVCFTRAVISGFLLYVRVSCHAYKKFAHVQRLNWFASVSFTCLLALLHISIPGLLKDFSNPSVVIQSLHGSEIPLDNEPRI